MKENYDLRMQKQIESLNGRKKLLLHACCAPCAAGCIERVLPYFDVTFLFYNPNIDSETEYNKRAAELIRFAEEYPAPLHTVVLPFRHEEFFSAVRGLENEPERGSRCTVCYRLRLEETAKYASENSFDFFATTLTLSPLKDSQRLNQIGEEVGNRYRTQYLYTDFKKHGGNLRSIELCREYRLYRQDYCGCVFSKSKRE